MAHTKILPPMTISQLILPPLSAPASIITTPIIAAWLTAKAPIRTKESVFERKLNIISNSSKKLCTKNIGLLPSITGVFFSTMWVIGSFNMITTRGTANITIKIMAAGSDFPVRNKRADTVKVP